MSKAKVTEVRRYPVGISVSGSGNRGGKAFPSVHMVYEALMSDGSWKLVRGVTVHTVPGLDCLNGTKKSKAEAWKKIRGDLTTTIEAASVLLRDLEHACLSADGQLKGANNV